MSRTRFSPRLAELLLPASISLLLSPISANAERGLRIHVTDDRGDALPCRIYVLDSEGRPHYPVTAPRWEKGFVCGGEALLRLGRETYRYRVERGPEWTTAAGAIDLREPESELKVSLRRIADLNGESWFAGDLHVHRAPAELPLHLRAEDLAIASVQTWWNETNPWGQITPREPVRRVGDSRFYHVLSGEDERGGGALLFHRMSAPLDITGAEREWPASTANLYRADASGAWVEIEKPFWWDTPTWLATGKVDSIGIAQNHMNRTGILEGEAWGRPRDRGRFPGVHGNGLYTQELYYKILNCGFRIPPSAGSASGVLQNPVGYNRVYVHAGAPLSWEKWWSGLREGRCFVTNGPLLRVTANGELPGEVLRVAEGAKIQLEGKLDSRDPIKSVQLVHNGEVRDITLPATVEITAGGWLLVRAIADVDHTFRFASTAPWYVEIDGDRALPKRDAVEFFLGWVKQRREQVAAKVKDPEKRREALAPQDAAVLFWEQLQARSE